MRIEGNIDIPLQMNFALWVYLSCHICNIYVVEYPISYDINDIHALSFPPIRYLFLWVSHMGVSPKKNLCPECNASEHNVSNLFMVRTDPNDHN